MSERTEMIAWGEKHRQMNMVEQLRAGEPGELFFDWFCKESSLKRKGETLAKKARRLVWSPKVDPMNSYVLFKNNCPMSGGLYDDFRICEIETQDVLWCVIPRDPAHDGQAVAYRVKGNSGDLKPEVVGAWADVERFFMNDGGAS